MNKGVGDGDSDTLLRASDPTRFFANQFAPMDKRSDLATLYAFDLEIRKISQTVREPMAGEIRLQWWREVFLGERDDEATANPLARATLELARKHQIDPEVLGRYLDGRIFDLYSDPIEDLAAFEAYAGQTDGTILQLACLILDRDQSPKAADLSGYLSCVSVLWARVIRRLGSGENASQSFRYLPPTMRNELGVSANPFLENDSPNSNTEISKVVGFANTYLEQARKTASNTPNTLKPAFLHLALVARQIASAQRRTKKHDIGTLGLIWLLWRSSKKWPCF